MAKARTRRPQTRRPAPARSRRPAAKSSARTTRVGQSSRKALSPHKGDIQGVFLVLLAVVMALGIWFEDGGRVGAFMALLFRNLFGYGAYAVPLLVAGLALALFWRPSTKDDMVAGRVTIGLLAVLVGGLGLLHLARGAPPPDSAPAVLQDSGGLVGAILAAPLARLLSTWGAGALFACVLFLGTLISTRTSVAAVARGITSMGRLAGSTLTAPPRPPPPPPSPPEVVEPVDSGEAPPRRRGRRRPEPAPEPDPDDTIEVVVGPPGAEEHDEAAALKAPPPPTAPADLPGAGDAVQLAMTLQAQAGGAYTTPPESLLRQGHARPVDPKRLDETQRILEQTLEQFEVAATVPRYTRGPTVTRYEVELEQGVKVARVIGLSHDIAYALASPDVRIIAPIPGKSAIGIEVPNRDRELVTLGDILGKAGEDDNRHPLTVALGKDIGGEPVTVNLADMPHVLIAGSTGAGKALALDTPVPTPTGWTTMGELRDGDMVFGADGQPTKVLKAHDVLLGEPCYEVEFDDGTVIVASADHLWLTADRAARVSMANAARRDAAPSRARDRLALLDGLIHHGSLDELVTTAELADEIDGMSAEYVSNVAKVHGVVPMGSKPVVMQQHYQAIGRTVLKPHPARTYRRGDLLAALRARAYQQAFGQRTKCTGPRVVTTQDIHGSLRVDGYVNHSIDVCGALDHPESDLPVDPYVLGCWLGDGHSFSAQFTCADREIIANIETAGFEVRKQAWSPYAWGIIGLRKHLHELGLLGNKHVPDAYLRAAPKQRLALLQGLMDTDGSNGRNGSVQFTNTNRRLAEAVVELAVSLGHKAVLREGRATLQGRDCGPKYGSTWTPPDPVFRLSRKLDRQKLTDHRGVQGVRYIVDVRPVPSRPVRCITVDAADHLYLASRSCIPTHNSVSLNVLVTSLLMRNAPEDVRLILIDPKRVELTHYENVPHLITPVVTHPKRASEALAWAVREMELRLETLAIAGVRNIAAYNKAARDGTLPPLPSAGLDDEGRPGGSGGLRERSGSPPVDPTRQRPTLPYIVVVIDELSDLMMVAPRDVEDAICRIAQMARAVGIHLVVATQRPSVDVVTGLIKANIPSRIAFMVASAQDSRVILDAGGADKLVGHGDMLYLPGGTSKPRRVQGAFITEKEVEAVVAYCKAQQQAAYQPGVVAEGRAASEDDDGDEDPLLTQAMEIVVRSGLGSTSMLQSKMKVGFSRARRIMDQLEERGVVGPSEGSKPRDVLMTVEELEQLRGREETYGEIVSE
jgi:FtsK alpha domain/Ftsk gamma domain/FtsK/SpoIIIE family/4TM region of DNA translocase FtsK/SpoIIIE/LAGLIDADG-like domain